MKFEMGVIGEIRNLVLEEYPTLALLVVYVEQYTQTAIIPYF